jgi:hypothetical protein
VACHPPAPQYRPARSAGKNRGRWLTKAHLIRIAEGLFFALRHASAYCGEKDSKPKKTEHHMRQVLIAALAVMAGLTISPTLSNATPGTGLAVPAITAGDALVQKVQIFPRRYYRQYPYGAPPVVVPAIPVAPPVVVEGPDAVVVVPPPRPASCGEYRYWNGQYCVDARYNRPYLGPRP